MACDFPNGKAVQVCMSDYVVRYSYGTPGQTSELALSLRFGEGATALPWNGTGREIVDGVRLQNNDVFYEVYAGFDRLLAIDDTVESKFGSIVILDANEELIARLICIPETVDYTF